MREYLEGVLFAVVLFCALGLGGYSIVKIALLIERIIRGG
jgi:hypothetical protein